MKKFGYLINNNDISHLRHLGFTHIGDGVYQYSFPGYIWQGYQTIQVKITAFDDSKDILIDVFQEDGNFYAPYYHEQNYEDHKVLSVIKHNIETECRKLKIRKV